MPEWTIAVLAAYGAGFIATLLVSFMIYTNDGRWRVQRQAARWLLLSPLWLVMVLLATWRGLVGVWESADWGRA